MTSSLNKLKIAPRLILCFALIILLMLAGNILLAWQFRPVNQYSDRVSALARELVAVSRFQMDLLSLDAKLDSLAKSEDIEGLKQETRQSRPVLAADIEAVRNALVHLPSDLGGSAPTQPIVEAVETTLSSQLDAVINLGGASDWNAVRLRLADEKKPLEARTSDLVRSVQQQVSDELVQSVAQSERVKSRILLILPLTAFFTLLFAILLGIANTRSIIIPLRQLLQGSAALAQGNFDYEVQLWGKDELAHVGAVFNQTSAKLGDLYRKLEEAQRIAHVGYWEWDLQTDHMVWSDEIYRIFGMQPQQYPIDLTASLERIHPVDRPLVTQAVEKALAGGTRFDVEARILRPTGELRIVHSMADVKRDASGRPYLMFGTNHDITERKHAEQERERLRQLEADLAHVNRVSTLGEMAASLAHEIKQPLAATIASANTCIEWLSHDPPNVDRARAAAARIDKYGNRATEIIDRIRSFYKKSPPQRELVDVNENIQEILTLLKGQATSNLVTMNAELAVGLPKTMADRVQLQQVLMNLILNAIEAMKESGGELTVKSELQNGQLQFSVSDAGVGLPTEKLDQVFSPFFTTKPQGSGMGLAISRSIVESHGGRLWATANDGRGATFHFTLPVEVRESAQLAT